MILQWLIDGWEEYIYWQTEDRKTLKKINSLLSEVLRHPTTGTGKPEPLRGYYSNIWSRRIDKENRLIYSIEDDVITILSCKGHYKDIY